MNAWELTVGAALNTSLILLVLFGFVTWCLDNPKMQTVVQWSLAISVLAWARGATEMWAWIVLFGGILVISHGLRPIGRVLHCGPCQRCSLYFHSIRDFEDHDCEGIDHERGDRT